MGQVSFTIRKPGALPTRKKRKKEKKELFMTMLNFLPLFFRCLSYKLVFLG